MIMLVLRTEFNVKFGVDCVCVWRLGALSFEITWLSNQFVVCLSPGRHEKAPIKIVAESEISL